MTSELSRKVALLKKKAEWLVDFDGTVADTEPLQKCAYEVVLKSLYDLDLLLDFERYRGFGETHIYRQLEVDYGITIDDGEFFDARIASFYQLASETRLKPFGLLERMLRSDERPARVKIVSSQKRHVIERMLDHWNLRSCFDEILTGEQLAGGKLELLETLRATRSVPHDVCFFDDARAHLLCAKRLGFFVVGIESSTTLAHVPCDLILQKEELV